MQPFHDLSLNPAPFFRKYNRVIAMIMVVPVVLFLSGCNYFKISQKPADVATYTALQNPKKYFIVHYKDKAAELTDIEINQTSKTITGKITTLAPKHRVYLDVTDTGSRPRHFSKRHENPTNEIHLFVNNLIEHEDGTVVINESDLAKLEVYDWAVGSTVASYVFSSIGIVAGALVIVAVIVLATKSSCPFVYVKDGKEHYFHGEIFSGAIYPSMEKDDYLPIVLQHDNDTLALKIANELLEVQNINLAQLLTVSHPENTSVLMDKMGKLHTLGIEQSEAKEYGSTLPAAVLNKADGNYCFFEKETDGVSEIELSFKKAKDQQKAKLVVKGKNSMWLDYMYGKFNESFGFYYNRFAAEQSKKTKAENVKWYQEQNIPLSVYVETKTGWKFVDYFDVVGPLADRDLVMEIDLNGIEEDHVNIKLQTGFRFWELDYVALDFTSDRLLSIQTTQAAKVLDQDGKNVLNSIKATDSNYLVQQKVGDFAQFSFVLPAKIKGEKQTHFLHSRGYYRYIRDYGGIPDLVKLNGFKAKGSFNIFAKEEYQKVYENDALISKIFNNEF